MGSEDVLSLILPLLLVVFGAFLLRRPQLPIQLDRRVEEWLRTKDKTAADLARPSIVRPKIYLWMAAAFYVLLGVIFFTMNLVKVLGLVSDVPN